MNNQLVTIEVTNDSKQNIGRGGHSFPAGETKVVSVKEYRVREITGCRFLNTNVFASDPDTSDGSEGGEHEGSADTPGDQRIETPESAGTSGADPSNSSNSSDTEQNEGGEGEQVVIQTHDKGTEGEIKATEAAVRFAKTNHVNLADVTGTGRDGQITKSDVEQHTA